MVGQDLRLQEQVRKASVTLENAATRSNQMRRALKVVEALPEGEAQALSAYDALREKAKPRYPEIHGPAPEGCTWTENVARQLSVPERAGFRAWLRSRGFALD